MGDINHYLQQGYTVYIQYPQTFSSAPHLKAFTIHELIQVHFFSFSWTMYFVKIYLYMKGSEICTPLQSYTTSKTCKSQVGAWSSPHITSLTERTTQYIHDGALQQDARFYFVVTENRAVQHNLNTTMNYMKCLGISSFAPTPESHGIRGIRIFASQVSYWMRHQASKDGESVENSN